MKFEDWFYQDEKEALGDIRKPVNELDDLLHDFVSSLEEYFRQAYEAGYKRGVRDSK
jgi:hypothetical protein